MTNDPKAGLIYAIAAMDAYNRGYGSGIHGIHGTPKAAVQLDDRIKPAAPLNGQRPQRQ